MTRALFKKRFNNVEVFGACLLVGLVCHGRPGWGLIAYGTCLVLSGIWGES